MGRPETFSWSESLGVSGEQRALSNISDTAVELDDTLETNTAATMGRGSILERVNVFLDGRNGDLVCSGSLSEELGVVDTLGT